MRRWSRECDDGVSPAILRDAVSGGGGSWVPRDDCEPKSARLPRQPESGQTRFAGPAAARFRPCREAGYTYKGSPDPPVTTRLRAILPPAAFAFFATFHSIRKQGRANHPDVVSDRRVGGAELGQYVGSNRLERGELRRIGGVVQTHVTNAQCRQPANLVGEPL